MKEAALVGATTEKTTKRIVLPTKTRYSRTSRFVKMPRRPSASNPERRRQVVQYASVFIGCVLIVEALVGDKGLFAMLRAREQYRQLETQLAQARARNAALREEARRYREDPSAIEDAARRDFGMIKDGEKVFIIRDVVPPELKPRP
jgi:cell division protein FtsB